MKRPRPIDLKLRLLICLILLLKNVGISQTCIHSVTYDLHIEESSHLPIGTDVSSLPLLDILKGKSKNQRKRVELCVDANQQLTITTIWEADAPETSRHNPIYKSISDSEGTKLYGFDGQLLEVSSGTESNTSWILSTQQISELGWHQALPNINDEQLQDLNDAGLTAFRDDEKVVVLHPDREIFYNTRTSSVLVKFFNGDTLQFSLAREYQLVSEDRTILQRLTEKDYLLLSTGDLLQKRRITTYLSYRIVDQGKVLVDFVTPDSTLFEIPQVRNHNSDPVKFGSYEPEGRVTLELKVFPNPASDRIRLSLPDLSESGVLRLLDSSGKIMLEQVVNRGMNFLDIDIRSWPIGIYSIQYCSKRHWIGQRLVKL